MERTGEQFGAWLRQRRRQLDLTQKELAARIGYGFEMVRSVESQRARPSKDMAHQLASVLQIAPADVDAFVEAARAGYAPTVAPVQVAGTVQPLVSAAVPSPPTSLVGRVEETASVVDLLLGPRVRLLTLTGPPGVGKTRLSLNVAVQLTGRFRDGVHFVELAPLKSPDLVLRTIGDALKLRESRQDFAVELRAYLSDKHLLMVLDNFEHVLEAAPLVGRLLLSGANVKVLTTSRERLRLYGEHVYPVPPLPVPDPTSTTDVLRLREFEAVQLFVDRAQAARLGFDLDTQNSHDVAAICHRLDGLPLALELAAAQIESTPLEGIVAALDNQMALLRTQDRDRSDRQLTMRGAIEWSYNLLEPAAQSLLRALSVFAGGFTNEAAIFVSGSEPIARTSDAENELARLVTRSLVRTTAASPRYRMALLEVIREYALDQAVDSSEIEALRGRHAQFFLKLAEEAADGMRDGVQAEGLMRLELEHDNLRVALAYSSDRAGSHQSAIRLAAALWRFWWIRGHLAEGRRWTQRVLGLDLPPDVRVPRRAELLNGAGVLAWQLGEYVEAKARFEESLASYRELGDGSGAAGALNSLGNLAWSNRQFHEAESRYLESLGLHQKLGDEGGTARCLNNLGTLASDRGAAAAQAGDASEARAHFDDARLRHQDSLAIRRRLADQRGIALSLHNLGELAVRQGDAEHARPLLQQALRIHVALGEKALVAGGLGALARVAWQAGQAELSARLFGATDALRREARIAPAQTDAFTYGPSIAAAKSALGETRYTMAWTMGHEYPTAAIAEALKSRRFTRPRLERMLQKSTKPPA